MGRKREVSVPTPQTPYLPRQETLFLSLEAWSVWGWPPRLSVLIQGPVLPQEPIALAVAFSPFNPLFSPGNEVIFCTNLACPIASPIQRGWEFLMLPGNPSTVVFCDHHPYPRQPPLRAQGTPSAFSLAEPLLNQSMPSEVVPGWLGEGPGHPCRPLCSHPHGGYLLRSWLVLVWDDKLVEIQVRSVTSGLRVA